ncbi:peptidase S7 [Natroniella sulfidigena]|uniref:peptidase S7 n=1 Tax=Natroniella sulfidigena TaxID=723921 RepID=UPI002009F644|nr:peptidase S7 [Natroniella sulfidigena]MCK8816564.1 peptidase S7 [Natroniella sulfidigena]
MRIKGIAKFIVDRIVERSKYLSQGRSVGAIGFVNQEGYIDALSELVNGGLSGIPYREMLSKVVEADGKSLLEIINQLPDNAVIITTNPGKTGIIVGTGGVSIFNCPLVRIGVKMGQPAGVGIIYPEPHYFELATESEEIQLERLTAKTMDQEREILRNLFNLRLKYLDISQELEVIEVEEQDVEFEKKDQSEWEVPFIEVNSLCKEFATKLVDKSTTVEQGREVAALGEIKDGHIVQKGEIVVGGMGYVPSRMLASSYTDITEKSLREVYSTVIPNNVAIVHTHPGGTGVMHMGDAKAGPGTWGRPVVAIGHNKEGEIKGATVIELLKEVAELDQEYEEIGQEYYEADTPEEEAKIRKRRFGIAQEYTDLCKPLEIK